VVQVAPVYLLVVTVPMVQVEQQVQLTVHLFLHKMVSEEVMLFQILEQVILGTFMVAVQVVALINIFLLVVWAVLAEVLIQLALIVLVLQVDLVDKMVVAAVELVTLLIQIQMSGI
jgi:hypothetical protein